MIGIMLKCDNIKLRASINGLILSLLNSHLIAITNMEADMPVSLDSIENEVNQMNEGQKRFYKIDEFESQEQLDQAFEFLRDISFSSSIRVVPHQESKTGNRNVDVIIVTKL